MYISMFEHKYISLEKSTSSVLEFEKIHQFRNST